MPEDNRPEASSSDEPAGPDRVQELERELTDIRKELETANARLQKRSLERQLAKKAADAAYDIVKEQNDELTELVTRFRKFVPATLSAMLDSKGFDVSRGVSLERHYTVLSTDIRNFTSFTESIPCQECFKFLNSFFTVMEPGIRENGGFVYQYVGDCIMALFPLVEGKFTDNAVRASLHLLRDVIPEYNAGRARAGYDPIRIGIGLNTGSVATGIAGTQERMDACAFGSTVNLAARCEGLTKEVGADLIITGDTFEKLREKDDYEMNRLGETTIRGMERRIDLFEVVSSKK